MIGKNIEKIIWEEDSFDFMNWHDNRIYAISFWPENHELVFDIDYILEWIKPEQHEIYFKFRVAPATLVFKNVYDLEISCSLMDVVIENISKENPVAPLNAKHIKEQFEYDWTIETTQGAINFKSVGFTQFIRNSFLSDSQQIDPGKRGGISFQRIPTV